MAQKSERKVSLYAKIAIVANILLFFSFGFRYLIIKNTGNFIGWMLLMAGITNIILLLVNFNTKNTFFMILNLVFAGLTFIVMVDFWSNNFFRYIWLAITLYYLITGLYFMYVINKEKKKKTLSN